MKQKRKRRELSQPPIPQMNYSQILADGLGFEEDDLMMNRGGLISQSQSVNYSTTLVHVMFEPMSRLPPLVMNALILSPIAVFLWVVLLINSIESPSEFTGVSHTIPMIWLVVTIILIMFLLYLVFNYVSKHVTHMQLDMRGGYVDYVIGEVFIDDNKPMRITIHDEHYKLPREGQRAFHHIDRYVIYYLPHSRWIVSAEPLND